MVSDLMEGTLTSFLSEQSTIESFRSVSHGKYLVIIVRIAGISRQKKKVFFNIAMTDH